MRQIIDRWLGRPGAVLALFLVSLLCGWHGFDLLLRAITGRPFHFQFTVNLRTTQYFFNYQDLGFVKRGLIGTCLHPFPGLTTRFGIAALSWFLLLLFAVLFWRFFISSTEAVAQNGRGVLALLCATIPAFFLRLGYDFGRFDVVDLIAAVVCFNLLAGSRWFLASIPAALAILVHEDFILFELPLIAALAIPAAAGAGASFSGRRAEAKCQWVPIPPAGVPPLRSWAALLALPAAATLLVGICGRSRMDVRQLMNYFASNKAFLAAAPGGEVNVNEVTVLTRTLWDNFLFNGRMFVEKRASFHIPIILAWFWFAVRYAGGFYKRNGLAIDLPFYTALTPLLLALVGFDYYRWVAMAAVNLVFVMLLKCRQLAKDGAAPVIAWDLNAKVLMGSALLGPISNTKSFPYLFLVLDKFSPWPIPW